MTREAFAVWRLDHDRLDTLIERVEEAERVILAAVRCPSDPLSLYAILSGKQRAPWPQRTAARAKQRALHAMHVLLQLSIVRQHMGLTGANTLRAAHAALLAGLYAGDSALHALDGATATTGDVKGGKARGRAITATAIAHDRAIARAVRQWTNSDDLQEDYGYRSPVAYVRHQTKLQTRAIQRAMKRLGLSSRQ